MIYTQEGVTELPACPPLPARRTPLALARPPSPPADLGPAATRAIARPSFGRRRPLSPTRPLPAPLARAPIRLISQASHPSTRPSTAPRVLPPAAAPPVAGPVRRPARRPATDHRRRRHTNPIVNIYHTRLGTRRSSSPPPLRRSPAGSAAQSLVDLTTDQPPPRPANTSALAATSR
ncbi:uncharacterized protein A4U43_C04F1650 [Asparagus officinalis]|uniref:Uncharacterized protein n=1 Tax=Asparagus officinalis TaxID=4686 RepID=A0A5P1EXF1_ASPOF|nr:uncharacterized protein A4U43_C04F1650 [Asparagus officinalis]